MTEDARLQELKNELRSQIIAIMKDQNKNYRSFDKARSTVSNLCRHGEGNIESLLSIADELDCSIVIMPKV